MSHKEAAPRDFRLHTYVLISSILAIPVLLWPFSLVLGLQPSFGVSVAKNWVVSASIMLLAATVADSILSMVISSRKAWIHITWLAVTAALIPGVLNAVNSAYLLALMFFVHALRSSWSLWQGECDWWLWPAWIRDVSTAMVLLLWLVLFAWG